MKKFLLAIAASLAVCGAVQAQPPQDMLAGRVAALEAKVAALEARLNPPAAQPVMYYSQPMYAQQFGAVGGFGACGPQGCGPAPALRGAGLFRRR